LGRISDEEKAWEEAQIRDEEEATSKASTMTMNMQFELAEGEEETIDNKRRKKKNSKRRNMMPLRRNKRQKNPRPNKNPM